MSALMFTCFVTPFEVPHRDEISETVGFKVKGPEKTIIHLPDIDSWTAFSSDNTTLMRDVDVAWLDGTFFDANELPHRDLSTISHPLMQESLSYFASLPEPLRRRIRFTHLNHSNPACNPASEATRMVLDAGFCIADENECVSL